MPKQKKDDAALSNLKGFFKRGARFESDGSIPTGHFELDFIMNYGEHPSDIDLETQEDYNPGKTLGVPLGKIVELYGEPGAGKSSLAYRIVGYAQKAGYDCCWIDTEHSFSEQLAEINGVDFNELLYSNMANEDKEDIVYAAEDILENIQKACKFNSTAGPNDRKIGIIVVDSVAHMTPRAVLESDADKQHVSPLARLLSQNLGKISNYASKYGVTIIFINQVRDKVGVMFGSPLTTPGGHSIKFAASLRLKVMRKKSKDANIYIEKNGKQKLIGGTSRVYIDKNRFSKPYGEGVEIPIYYEPYFPDILELTFSFARQLRLVKKRLDTYKWRDVSAEGSEEFLKHIKFNKLTNDLLDDVLAEAKEQNVIVPPEIVLYKKSAEEELKEVQDADDNDEKTKVSRRRKKKVS